MKVLPAFRSRNYRLFFAGQLISLVGTWMQQIAMIWLAYRLTDSIVMLGLVGFASQIPILLFGILAGVWNDRIDRRRLLLLAFLLGCINAVDLPARQAFVAQLVSDRADLANAIGLNSLLMNGAANRMPSAWTAWWQSPC